jgi:hypothetical protein
MRIRTILKAAAVPAIIAGSLLGTTLAASASTGPNAAGNASGQQGHLTGNQALIYQDPQFGGVQCNENQHPAFTNVTCKFVNGVPSNTGQPGKVTSWAANFTPGQTGSVQWVNDFGGNSIIGTLPDGSPIPSTNGILTYTITGPMVNGLPAGPATGYTGTVVYSS